MRRSCETETEKGLAAEVGPGGISGVCMCAVCGCYFQRAGAGARAVAVWLSWLAPYTKSLPSSTSALILTLRIFPAVPISQSALLSVPLSDGVGWLVGAASGPCMGATWDRGVI